MPARGAIPAALLCGLIPATACRSQDRGPGPGEPTAPGFVVRSDGSENVILSAARGTGEPLLAFWRSPWPIVDLKRRPVPGSPAIAVTWNEMHADGPHALYSFSLDGERFLEPQRTSYELALRSGPFDPRASGLTAAGDAHDLVAGLPRALASRPESRLRIVQYWTRGIEPYRAALRSRGVEILFFLANHANVVEMDAAAVEVVEALPFVRWVGPFEPAYKLEEGLLRAVLDGLRSPDELRVNILSTRADRDTIEAIEDRIRNVAGRLVASSPSTQLVTADLTPAGIAALAGADEVQWIDRWFPPDTDSMNVARAFHGANAVQGAGFTGAGVRVEVLDKGCDLTHAELANHAVHGTNTPSAHGTCVSGIVVGTGAGQPSARGTLPSGFLVVADFDTVTDRGEHTEALQDPMEEWRCVLQSNSWGHGYSQHYTSFSFALDKICFDNPRLSIVQSQGNSGTKSSRQEAWAKNVVSVGGLRHWNTTDADEHVWNGIASIGPAADGRIKPDLASFADEVHCTDRPGGIGYSTGEHFQAFGGTSAATPIVAGHMGLLYEIWSQGAFGNPTPGTTVFENRPQATTMKALVINTASQWDFTGASHDRTRTHQGWGHPDVSAAWSLRSTMLVVDETDVLTETQSTVYSVTVPAGTPALKATLVYRDVPGTTSSTRHRVNDLDLRVQAPGNAAVYHGNNGMLSGTWTPPGGQRNEADTVENVFVPTPTPGTWQVVVHAFEVNADTHVETAVVDVDYALVVHGIDP